VDEYGRIALEPVKLLMARREEEGVFQYADDETTPPAQKNSILSEMRQIRGGNPRREEPYIRTAHDLSG